MNATTAEKIFTVAIKLPTPQERAAYVRGAAGEDQALRQQVESLIQAHEEVGGFMPTDPGEAMITIPDRPLSEQEGTCIGRYKPLQKIGEGGMGVIYMAEQTEPVTRKVALKIIKLGMDTKSVIARFEAERQALAMMDHPNIAKVLDAGATDTGGPYIVMRRAPVHRDPLRWAGETPKGWDGARVFWARSWGLWWPADQRGFGSPASCSCGRVVPELVGGRFGKEVGFGGEDLGIEEFRFDGVMNTLDVGVGIGTRGGLKQYSAPKACWMVR